MYNCTVLDTALAYNADNQDENFISQIELSPKLGGKLQIGGNLSKCPSNIQGVSLLLI